MSKSDIIRAWKDAVYRKSLSSEEQALMPAHPAGEILLTEEEMASVSGGIRTGSGCTTVGCPTNQPAPCTHIGCTIGSCVAL